MLDFRASKNKNIPKRTTYDEGSGGSERMDGPTYL